MASGHRNAAGSSPMGFPSAARASGLAGSDQEIGEVPRSEGLAVPVHFDLAPLGLRRALDGSSSVTTRMPGLPKIEPVLLSRLPLHVGQEQIGARGTCRASGGRRACRRSWPSPRGGAPPAPFARSRRCDPIAGSPGGSAG